MPPPASGSAPPSAAPAEGPGTILRPPMPGKVIEVRVKDGDRVVAGQVLLVLEAMKMRNDVLATSSGVVREVRVVAGANVRAREAMLRIEPTPAG
jgi:biotin carboxyl carrier protein